MGSADAVGLAVVGAVDFTVGLEVALEVGLAVGFGFTVALGEAFTLALAVGVGFLVAASALVAEKVRQSASTSADFFSRAPT